MSDPANYETRFVIKRRELWLYKHSKLYRRVTLWLFAWRKKSSFAAYYRRLGRLYRRAP